MDKLAQEKKKFVHLRGSRFEVTPDGLFYSPDPGKPKKHDCPDCYFCQVCSDSRCSLCRDEEKLSRKP